MNWEKILHSLEEGILIIRDSKVIFANKFLVDNQIIREDWQDKNYYEALKSLSLISLINKALNYQEFFSEEFQHLERFYRVKVRNVDDFVLLNISDISFLKKYELSRKEFVDNASHELKTPISVIKGILETLIEEEEQEGKRKFLEKALNRVNQMQNLVEDLLTLTKLESGRERLNLSEFKLKDLVDEVYEDLKEEFAKRRIAFENLVDSSFTITADRQKFYLLLRNLIDNGVKYNKEGGKVWVSSKRDKEGYFIEVGDTGIGIPKEHIPLIFERFYRVDKGRSREMGGTGLGLSIVKHIVLAHGGEIKAYSEPEKGTRFVITIPVFNRKLTK
ncbi:sensor histidine kinase [Thermocrinis sp.]